MHDIFSDKSNEWTIGMCAKTTQRRDLLQLTNCVNEVAAGGVEFSYDSLLCQVCKDPVTPSHLRVQANT